jgi:hypothetical protein
MSLKTRTLLVAISSLVVALVLGGLAWSLLPSPIPWVVILLLIIGASIFLNNWFNRNLTVPLNQFSRAIKAVELAEYKPGLLAELKARQDELGKISVDLDAMATEVAARDRRLKLLLRVIPVGVALSLESDFQRLLETIVVESQALTNADGGTLYILEGRQLKFVILRNTSLKITMGGTTDKPISFPPIAMFDEKTGQPNHHNVASYTAHGHEWVNIPDAYQTDDFDFSGTRTFDERSGYKSHSFLTIPLEGEDQRVIGVLQLINAMDPQTGAIQPFRGDEVLKTLVLLASNALAGYIRQERLRKEIEKLNIEIDHAKRSRQVSEITETDYFRALLKKVRELRFRKKQPADQ